MTEPSFCWREIEDLPTNWQQFSSRELESLAPIWEEQSKRLTDSRALRAFNEKLKREWAIETGIIEGLYSIDRGVTQVLIERGLEASLMPHGSTDIPAEEIVKILRDQKDVLEGLFDFIAQRRALSTSYIKEVHSALTQHQNTVTAFDQFGNESEIPLLRGDWKTLPNNPTRPDGRIHQYCPPEHVAAEMDRLIEMHRQHCEDGVPPEVEAAWLHHRFTQIHPFQDGNGRIARTIASLVFLRAGWFPLVINRDMRASYIEALENADAGDIGPLVALFSKVQKRSFLGALNLSEGVLQATVPVQQVIGAAMDRLRARMQGKKEEQKKVFSLAERLLPVARKSMAAIRDELERSLSSLNPEYHCYADQSADATIHWFNRDIIEMAKHIGYFADTRTFRAWVKLTIKEERQTNIVVSMHSIGTEFVGVLGASAFVTFKDAGENGEAKYDGPHALSDEVFQFAFNEPANSVESRFEEWLGRALITGLEQWRRQL